MAFISSAIAGAASLIGASDQSDAAQNAAQTQQAAADKAKGYLTSSYGQIQANNQPWMNAGTGALGQMSQMTAGGAPQFTAQDFLNNKDPAYGFDMQQGLDAVQASAAARGALGSGGTLKAMNNYAQGMASNEYGKAYDRFMNANNTQFSRLGSIAGMGLQATGMQNNAASNYGSGMSELTTGAGNAQAASQIAQGNIWGGAISGIGSGLANNLSVGGMMSQMQGRSPYGTMPPSMMGGGGAYMPAGAADPSAGGMYGASALQAPALGSGAGLGSGSPLSLIAAGG